LDELISFLDLYMHEAINVVAPRAAQYQAAITTPSISIGAFSSSFLQGPTIRALAPECVCFMFFYAPIADVVV
jgi:hypothetical protein